MTVWILVAMLALAPAGEQQVAIYTAGPAFQTLAACLEVASQVTSRAMGCVETTISRAPPGHQL
jgi:hypothetical protein